LKTVCPEGIEIIEEYVWDLKFLVVIVDRCSGKSDGLR